ncbi:MAG: hypothetical protein HQK53_18970 [Oligoflexia bacterium]|nr:hypothetical protein [Oligoflexia bacterium]
MLKALFLSHLALLYVYTSAFANEVTPSDFDESEGMNKEVPVCLEWGTRRECINRQICTVFCGATLAAAAVAASNAGYTMAGAIVTGGIGTKCENFCKLVPECSDIRVCVRYSTDYPH